MALFTVKTSKKVETSMRLEESTAKMLDRYAHFHKGPADDVVNEALEYIFRHDKDFQQHLQQNPNQEVAASVRIKKAPGSAKAAKSERKQQRIIIALRITAPHRPIRSREQKREMRFAHEKVDTPPLPGCRKTRLKVDDCQPLCKQKSYAKPVGYRQPAVNDSQPRILADGRPNPAITSRP